MLNGTCTLLQVRRVSTVILRTEMQWENAIENSKKYDSSAGLGSGMGLKKKQRGKLNGQTLSSGHQKPVKIAIKQYTRCSNAQRVIEQKDSSI